MPLSTGSSFSFLITAWLAQCDARIRAAAGVSASMYLYAAAEVLAALITSVLLSADRPPHATSPVDTEISTDRKSFISVSENEVRDGFDVADRWNRVRSYGTGRNE